MTLGVVIPCHEQERFLPRTLAALERALESHEWRGVLVMATAAAGAALPALEPRWRVVRPAPRRRPLTPGAARNLGLAACGGEWVLFVDADVEIDRDWLVRACAEAESAARVAGLWGRLEEWFVDGDTERPGARDMYRVGDGTHDVDYLATLAFYRRDALEQAGAYDPRLASEEDFELGLRLRARGDVLRSIGSRAGRHWSAPRPSFAEIGRRWRTGLCFGQGQVLRLYVFRAGFGTLLRRQAHYLATLALWLLAVPALALGGARGLALWALAPLAVFVVMSVRKRSSRLALHSLLTWTVNAAGMVGGFLGPLPSRAEAA